MATTTGLSVFVLLVDDEHLPGDERIGCLEGIPESQLILGDVEFFTDLGQILSCLRAIVDLVFCRKIVRFTLLYLVLFGGFRGWGRGLSLLARRFGACQHLVRPLGSHQQLVHSLEQQLLVLLRLLQRCLDSVQPAPDLMETEDEDAAQDECGRPDREGRMAGDGPGLP